MVLRKGGLVIHEGLPVMSPLSQFRGSKPKVHCMSTGKEGIGALLVGSAARSGTGYSSPVQQRGRTAPFQALRTQTGPTHGFHQCGIKPTGLDSVSPYISSLALHTLE